VPKPPRAGAGLPASGHGPVAISMTATQETPGIVAISPETLLLRLATILFIL